ncbi:hypothetical protein [Pantoea sp. Cy-639]|uniref:hypothetical protein n=1 Tax=Pantoea sp. Cy-639 TaxID=2608360 RepID=UPI0014232339|nr:hypothetical protein [Pantoea sp. Cy-639]NIF19670.1 hypothetical protein [Pantoea sp. Cy-639]
MAIENVMLTLNRIPEINAVIDAGTDYKTLAGFLLTVIAVVLGSGVTVYTFKRTVKSQEDVATAAIIRSSRQAWINEVRDCCSRYVAAVCSVSDLIIKRGGWFECNGIDIGQTGAWISFERENPDWVELSVVSVNETRALRAKIQMLLNSGEAETDDLLKAMDDAYERASKGEREMSGLCDAIVFCAQKIIKIEWERTKKGV